MQVVNTVNPMNPVDLAFPSTGLYRYTGISASRGLTWFDSDAGQGYIYPDWFENQSGVIRLSFPRRRESRICLSALPDASECPPTPA